MEASEMKQDIVDHGIEKAENEMRPVLQSLTKGTSEDLPERAGISCKEQDAHERQVDPEAVRESEKEAELDPTGEPEPGEGKPAA